jgi:hypothetical protein
MTDFQWIDVDALKPNARNARTHSKKQILQIANSIVTFGFLVPILVNEGRNIIAGHGRFEAAKLRGLKQVPVIEVKGLSLLRQLGVAPGTKSGCRLGRTYRCGRDRERGPCRTEGASTTPRI